ncbi:MAG: hypothetical protein V7K27_00375 [Nostoc sp.]
MPLPLIPFSNQRTDNKLRIAIALQPFGHPTAGVGKAIGFNINSLVRIS